MPGSLGAAWSSGRRALPCSAPPESRRRTTSPCSSAPVRARMPCTCMHPMQGTLGYASHVALFELSYFTLYCNVFCWYCYFAFLFASKAGSTLPPLARWQQQNDKSIDKRAQLWITMRKEGCRCAAMLLLRTTMAGRAGSEGGARRAESWPPACPNHAGYHFEG